MVFRYAVRLDYPNGGGPGYNIWHFRGPTAGTDSQQAVDAIQAFYQACIAYYQGGTTITGPDDVVADVDTGAPTFEAVDGFSLGPVAGTSTLPPALQAVVGWRTASATRSGRGRTFVGPLSGGAAQADGTPGPELLAAMATGAQAVLDYNGTIDDGALGVWSPTTSTFRDFTGFRIRDVFAVLRSRRD